MAWIVCGWYTPDYKPWADRLAGSLGAVGAPHDLVEVPANRGTWESITMQKPTHVMNALRKHSDRTVIFLDADCVARQPLDELASIRGDVGAHLKCKFDKGGRPRLGVRSSTLVLKPTEPARALVANWIAVGQKAPKGCVDRRTLPMALAMTPGLCLDILDVRFCAYASDKVADPVIDQGKASEHRPKISEGMRNLYARLGVRA